MFSVLFRYLVSVQVVNPEGLGPAATVEVATDEGGQYKKGESHKKERRNRYSIYCARVLSLFCIQPSFGNDSAVFLFFFVLAFPTFSTSMRNSAIGTRELDTFPILFSRLFEFLDLWMVHEWSFRFLYSS